MIKQAQHIKIIRALNKSQGTRLQACGGPNGGFILLYARVGMGGRSPM